jgi:large subunit ribosomal protein L18e
MKRTGPTNGQLNRLIDELKQTARKQEAILWRRVAFDLEKPTRQRRVVNVHRLERYARDGETIIVPGKVLGTGDLTHKVNVAAFTFSQQAIDKINKTGGKALAITDVLKENPKGKNVRILG